MKLNAKTKIDDLLTAYPFLLDFLISKSPKFKHLENPLMRKTIGKVATLAQAAAAGQIDLEELISGIARRIREKTGETVQDGVDNSSPETSGPLSDPAAREEALKAIIRDLHQGEDMESLKARFRTLIQDVSPSEIANMEQSLIEEGMPESEVKRLCDVHVAVFKEALEKQEIPEAPAGHPVHTFIRENRAAEEIMDKIDALLTELGIPPEIKSFQNSHKDLAHLVDRLAEINRHYLRKENQLFPLLEAHNISGPSQVMWAIHDDIRALIKKTRNQIAGMQAVESINTLQDLLSTIREMIYKEENILFLMSLDTLSESDWVKVRQGEEEIGYAWIEPEGDWQPKAEADEERAAAPEKIGLDTGYLPKDLINLLLTHLPVDLTLVDENDRVAYYSAGKERIFPRSPGIIGRQVQRCHPPDSIHIVNKILDEFKTGKKDAAEFWIQLGGKFIHIRYFALRTAEGVYKGCLEVSQDVTRIRQLEGEKRLLDWE
jgi:hypothetical protein